MPDKSKEIKALLQLLDDPDEEVFRHIAGNIVLQGEDIIPELEKAWETSLNTILQERIENLIREIQSGDLQKKLKKWKDDDDPDILYGAYLIAKYQYPELRFEEIKKDLDKIIKDIWIEINDNLTALEKVNVINHVFYKIHEFSGNSTNFYAPQNAFINHVISKKKGNPILLGIIYLHIAGSLDLPIKGINLPKNFILAWMDEYFILENEIEVLFYINPFNKGAVLGKREIDYFIHHQKLDTKNEYYYPCSAVKIIQRLIISLIDSYSKLGYPDKIRDLKKLLEVLK